MTKELNFTAELAQLMKFAGLTATAIRMYSHYNQSGEVRGRRVDPKRSPIDLMFLADALHHFERVGVDIESGDTERIVETCDELLRVFAGYEIDDPARPPQAKPTFELWAPLVKLSDATEALRSIRGKASSIAA